MAKKPVKTFHLFGIAKSLEAQNEVVGLLIANVASVANCVDRVSHEQLKKFVIELGQRAEEARQAVWPEED